MSSNERVVLLERIARLATELCVSVDKAAEDIGGERPALEILREIGPLTDQLEKLGPGLAAGVGVIDLAGSSSVETEAPLCGCVSESRCEAKHGAPAHVRCRRAVKSSGDSKK